ncbi:MAG: phospholipase/Carboxylesterase [Planctomycetaceae bacterium]|nr:phospholipase/Carboxylesterase [Planctomycetaceae bacterium]
MHLRSLSFYLLSFVLLAHTHAASGDEPYAARVFEDAQGKKLPYRIMQPEGYAANGTTKYPLVLFLHGAGERGTDNVKQLVHGTGDFAKPENRKKYPCFLIAPQCPEGKRWVEVEWTLKSHKQLPEDSESAKLTLELISSLEKEFRIDPKRRYVTGLSMGGFGTWDLITRHPDLWAAAVPICAGADEATAPKVAKMPIWAFHGDKDTVVIPERSRNMIMAISKAGGKPFYTEYPGVGHNSWAAAYADPQMMEWLFAQKRD